jgi:hypothetical protein
VKSRSVFTISQLVSVVAVLVGVVWVSVVVGLPVVTVALAPSSLKTINGFFPHQCSCASGVVFVPVILVCPPSPDAQATSKRLVSSRLKSVSCGVDFICSTIILVFLFA